MLTDTVESSNTCVNNQQSYSTRCPKLGVSAVLRSKSLSPSTTSPPRGLEDPLRLDETNHLTCRFRPGLRPVRLTDMTHFRVKRRQIAKIPLPDENEPGLRRSSTLLLSQSRRQPLKAYQQNTLPCGTAFTYRQEDLAFSPRDTRTAVKVDSQSYVAGRNQRISTNPKIRRCSSSNFAASRRSTQDSFPDQDFVEEDDGQNRKRRSLPTRPAKKIKSHDSLDSDASTEGSRRGKTTTSTKSSPPTSRDMMGKTGVMTRIRSQTQLAYEAVKRVVRRHSKRRSGSYELRNDAAKS